MVESLLGGVTTVADQHYVFVEGNTEPFIEEMIEGALETGIRLHAGRGSMTKGRRHGGVVPDNACQTIDEVLRHSQELIAQYHDPDPLARIRIDLAPCGVHTDEPEMYREFARLAADHPEVGLHTHLYEVIDTGFCTETYGVTPWNFLVENGWNHDKVWLAHMVDPLTRRSPSSLRPVSVSCTSLRRICAWAGDWRRCGSTSMPDARWGSAPPDRPPTTVAISLATSEWPH